MNRLIALTEGLVDEAVARRILRVAGWRDNEFEIYSVGGKGSIKKHIEAVARQATSQPWFVLVDLHTKGCAPALQENWLRTWFRSDSELPTYLCFRVAVRAVETWLLADVENLSRHWKIPRNLLPRAPEQEWDPKGRLVQLARRSRRRDIREDVVPPEGSTARVGRGYTNRVREFVASHWNPASTEAQTRAPSLARAISCLSRLKSSWRAAPHHCP